LTLVVHDEVDFAGGDVGEQALERGAGQGGAGDAAGVVAGLEQLPALVLLAGDVGGARFALGVERVEGLLEAVLRPADRARIVWCCQPVALAICSTVAPPRRLCSLFIMACFVPPRGLGFSCS
jgi:hypothetical protein